jgi:hypothetical protein
LSDDTCAPRDAFGLTADDWQSLLRYHPDEFTGPALLWWALCGFSLDDDPARMTKGRLPELLLAIKADACALARLASDSRDEEVRALGPALENLHRRIAVAAEIAARREP